ncbi:hypothetical protein STENM327S_07718 [Streptomyces tendae]
MPVVGGHPWEGRTFTAGWGARDVLDVALVDPQLVAGVAVDVCTRRGGRWRHPVCLHRVRQEVSVSGSVAVLMGLRQLAGACWTRPPSRPSPSSPACYRPGCPAQAQAFPEFTQSSGARGAAAVNLQDTIAVPRFAPSHSPPKTSRPTSWTASTAARGRTRPN